jgi:uncharacterized protein (DUF305 family)
MMRFVSRATRAVLLPAALLSACARPATEKPVATEPVAAGVPPAAARRYVDADVRFMQHMIEHHAQALAMTSLVPARAADETLRLVAQRIEVSQRDEIARMRQWLLKRGEPAPATGGSHEHSAGEGRPPMPGMLSPAELARLEESTGEEFDRLFLEYMIRHHEGALVMVSELFATRGAGQELDIFRFASDVDADQRAEIQRMRRMQSRLAGGQSKP